MGKLKCPLVSETSQTGKNARWMITVMDILEKAKLRGQ
jgi:hypothetical protein